VSEDHGSAPKPPGTCTDNCGHQLWSVEEIAEWTHDFSRPNLTVRAWAASYDIWADAHLSHEELRRRIAGAGGIACEHALKAIIGPGEAGHLSDGVHRWAVADELGLSFVPVEVRRQEFEAPMGWP
jgi:hypothetical protein